jgi:hypothetical protein
MNTPLTALTPEQFRTALGLAVAYDHAWGWLDAEHGSLLHRAGSDAWEERDAADRAAVLDELRGGVVSPETMPARPAGSAMRGGNRSMWPRCVHGWSGLGGG